MAQLSSVFQLFILDHPLALEVGRQQLTETSVDEDLSEATHAHTHTRLQDG
jgi:hypothetical protein